VLLNLLYIVKPFLGCRRDLDLRKAKGDEVGARYPGVQGSSEGKGHERFQQGREN
jgi:hypothetical protein